MTASTAAATVLVVGILGVFTLVGVSAYIHRKDERDGHHIPVEKEGAS